MLARVRELERQDREDAQRATLADLQRFVEKKQQEHDERIVRMREVGNKVPRAEMIQPAIFDGQPAMVRFQRNGELGLMEIFYGGYTPNPMDANNGHGHVIVRHGAVEEWLLPAKPGKKRKSII